MNHGMSLRLEELASKKKSDSLCGVHFLRVVKKSLESDYPSPEDPALRPIHGFATAISKAFLGQSPMSLTLPRGQGFPDCTKKKMRDEFCEIIKIEGGYHVEGEVFC